jgi:uncharacterized membrane protein YkgB
MTLWGIVIVIVIVLVVDRDVIEEAKKTTLGVIARLAMQMQTLTFRLTAGGSESKSSSQYADMIQGVVNNHVHVDEVSKYMN